jgi:hypothetical protein
MNGGASPRAPVFDPRLFLLCKPSVRYRAYDRDWNVSKGYQGGSALISSAPTLVRLRAIVCDDDNQAIERANQLLGDKDIEVWCSSRLVTKLNAKHPRAVTHEIKDGCLKPKKAP